MSDEASQTPSQESVTSRMERLESMLETCARNHAALQVQHSKVLGDRAFWVQLYLQQQQALAEYRQIALRSLEQMEQTQKEHNAQMATIQKQVAGMLNYLLYKQQSNGGGPPQL